MLYFKSRFKDISMQKVIENYFILEKTLFKMNEQMQFKNINDMEDKLKEERLKEKWKQQKDQR